MNTLVFKNAYCFMQDALCKGAGHYLCGVS